jgi:hypothetical protein
MLFTILIVLLLVSLIGGSVGYRRYGYMGWSPAGVVLVILAVMYFSGHVRFSGHGF